MCTQLTLTIRQSAFRKLGWEELHKLLIIFEQRPKYGNTELIVLRYVDVVDLLKCKKLLVISKYFLEEVLVDHILWWQVELAVYKQD